MFWRGHSVSRSGNLSNSARTMSVTMYPGEIVFTLIPCWPHSDARLRPSWITAAFDALYTLFGWSVGRSSDKIAVVYEEVMVMREGKGIGINVRADQPPISDRAAHTRDEGDAAACL